MSGNGFEATRSCKILHCLKNDQLDRVHQLEALLAIWRSQYKEPNFCVIDTLNGLAELVEKSYEEYLRQDPDPLDDRHPVKIFPSCTYGHMLKVIARSSDFLNKLCLSYLLARENQALNIASARLLISSIPSIEDMSIFADAMIPQLYRWAQRSSAPIELRCISFAVIAYATEAIDIGSKYRDENAALISVALKLLKDCLEAMELEESLKQSDPGNNNKDLKSTTAGFDQKDVNGHFPPQQNGESSCDVQKRNMSKIVKENCSEHQSLDKTDFCQNNFEDSTGSSKKLTNGLRVPAVTAKPYDEQGSSPPRKRSRMSESIRKRAGSLTSLVSLADDLSNSQWGQLQIRKVGDCNVYPITLVNQQKLILKYLIAIGVYEVLIREAYENRSREIIFAYLENANNRDVRLIYYVLRYASSLVLHRKFAMDFIAAHGIEKMICIQFQSFASIAVVICLHYLSAHAEVLEQMSLLSDNVVTQIVKYQLWMLEYGHRSSRTEATMFFAHAFQFRVFLEQFDYNDGARRLLNNISALRILQPDSAEPLGDEELSSCAEVIRDTCFAFNSYVTSHVCLKSEQSMRSYFSRMQSSMGIKVPSPKKILKLEDEVTKDSLWTLTHVFASNPIWKPVEALRQLGVVKTMFHIIGVLPSMAVYSKYEAIKYAIEVIWICSLTPRVQLDISEMQLLIDSTEIPAMGLILELCYRRRLSDPDIQKVALKILVNCACSPFHKPLNSRLSNSFHANGNVSTPKMKGGRKSMECTGALDRMLDCIRKHDGLMVLNNLLTKTAPITEADAVRAKVAQILGGMARSEEIRQILNVLPLIADNKLLGLMREPVLPDKRAEHIVFCEHAKTLIERITLRKFDGDLPSDFTQEKMWKTSIISGTKINFNEKELLELIHQHLSKKNLKKTAEQLRIEAGLPEANGSLPDGEKLTLKPFPNISDAFSFVGPKTLRFEGSGLANRLGTLNFATALASSRSLPSRNERVEVKGTPREVRLRRSMTGPSSKQTKTNSSERYDAVNPHKDLEGILMEYFRKQHMTCNNPVSTCPPFSVFSPHQCPTMKRGRLVSHNFVTRFNKKSISPLVNGFEYWKEDERFVFSRFRPVRTFSNEEETLTCCAFSIDDEHILLGSFDGKLQWHNKCTGIVESSTSCHSSAIIAIEQSQDGSLLLTSSAFRKPLSSLWKIGETQVHKYSFPAEAHVEFSKAYQDRVIGSSGITATVYDIETGQSIVVLEDVASTCYYMKNKATFHPMDNLVLNDGILWDTRCSTRSLHKFDKFNSIISGVFHPRGNEIIINAEVWDVRTYRLLHCVPTLDRCEILFNRTGNIFYAAMLQTPESEDTRPRHALSSSFRTFDAVSYEVISTVDTKKGYYNICADHNDQYVAIAELNGSHDENYSNVCRLYEVGKCKVDENVDDEDQDESGGSDGSNDDDEDGYMHRNLDRFIFAFGSDDADDDDELHDHSSSGDSQDDGAEGEDEDDAVEGAGGGSALPSASEESVNSQEYASGEIYESDVDESLEDFMNGDSLDEDEDETDEDLDEEMDESYDPDQDDRDSSSIEGTSSIVLNPTLRRIRREQDRS